MDVLADMVAGLPRDRGDEVKHLYRRVFLKEIPTFLLGFFIL